MVQYLSSFGYLSNIYIDTGHYAEQNGVNFETILQIITKKPQVTLN